MKLFRNLFGQSKHSPREVGLIISPSLQEFVKSEVLPGLDISPHYFWSSFENLVDKFIGRNNELLEKRNYFQNQINDWHIRNRNSEFDLDEYKNFLTDIGYIHPRSGDFKIETWNVDPEIRKIAGPQLVVPVMNARFALNAANARWGSLYDAIYGTDVISENKVDTWDKQRAIEVINYVREFFDKIVPIENTSWKNISKIKIENNNLVFLVDDKNCNLKNKNQFVGFSGEKNNPKSILFKNNNLHIDVIIDENSKIGKTDKAGIVHANIGKVSFSDDDLIKNMNFFLNELKNKKPESSKGIYLKKHLH